MSFNLLGTWKSSSRNLLTRLKGTASGLSRRKSILSKDVKKSNKIFEDLEKDEQKIVDMFSELKEELKNEFELLESEIEKIIEILSKENLNLSDKKQIDYHLIRPLNNLKDIFSVLKDLSETYQKMFKARTPLHKHFKAFSHFCSMVSMRIGSTITQYEEERRSPETLLKFIENTLENNWKAFLNQIDAEQRKYMEDINLVHQFEMTRKKSRDSA